MSSIFVSIATFFADFSHFLPFPSQMTEGGYLFGLLWSVFRGGGIFWGLLFGGVARYAIRWTIYKRKCDMHNEKECEIPGDNSPNHQMMGSTLIANCSLCPRLLLPQLRPFLLPLPCTRRLGVMASQHVKWWTHLKWPKWSSSAEMVEWRQGYKMHLSPRSEPSVLNTRKGYITAMQYLIPTWLLL